MDTPERRVWGERRPKDRVTLQIILVLTFTRPKSFTQGGVSVFDKYLHWPLCKCKSKNIYIYTLQHDKCKCKKIECVSVNDLDLHEIYTSYIQLLTLTCTTLVITNVGWVSQICLHQVSPSRFAKGHHLA
jgi:hypothetical protein